MTIGIFCASLLISCTPRFETTVTETDQVSTVPQEDLVMQSIIANARSTIGQFQKALAAPAADEYDFTVKYPFPTDPGQKNSLEHIWINSLKQIDGNSYAGIIQNEPFYIKDLKLGQEVTIDISQISDWMYMKDDTIVGGKSVKYLLENIPEAERDERAKALLEMFK